jgi:hypothetical protein
MSAQICPCAGGYVVLPRTFVHQPRDDPGLTARNLRLIRTASAVHHTPGANTEPSSVVL